MVVLHSLVSSSVWTEFLVWWLGGLQNSNHTSHTSFPSQQSARPVMSAEHHVLRHCSHDIAVSTCPIHLIWYERYMYLTRDRDMYMMDL